MVLRIAEALDRHPALRDEELVAFDLPSNRAIAQLSVVRDQRIVGTHHRDRVVHRHDGRRASGPRDVGLHFRSISWIFFQYRWLLDSMEGSRAERCVLAVVIAASAVACGVLDNWMAVYIDADCHAHDRRRQPLLPVIRAWRGQLSASSKCRQVATGI